MDMKQVWGCPKCGMLTTEPLLGSHDQMPYCRADNSDLDELGLLPVAAKNRTIVTQLVVSSSLVREMDDETLRSILGAAAFESVRAA